MIINLIVPAIIVYLYTDSFTPKEYFMYVMAFVFLQLSPIEFSNLPRRFSALIFSMGVVTLGLFINSLTNRYKNSYELAKNGLLNLSKQINKLAQRENLKSDMEELNRIIYKLNNLIYLSRNYKLQIRK